MAHTNAGWPTNIPAGGDNLNTTDDQLRRLRLDLLERMNEIVDDFTTDPVVPKQLDVSRVIGTPDLAVVYTNAAFAIPSGVNTAIDFVAETLDTGGFHDNASNPSRLTITTAGYYRIHAALWIAPGAAAGPIAGNMALRKNGSDIALSKVTFEGSSIVEFIDATYIDLAAAADYYEVWIIQASGQAWATLDEADEAYFMIDRLVGTT